MYQLCINNSIILCSIPYKGEILQAHIFREQPKNRIVMFTLLAVRLITLQLVLHTLLMIIFCKESVITITSAKFAKTLILQKFPLYSNMFLLIIHIRDKTNKHTTVVVY